MPQMKPMLWMFISLMCIIMILILMSTIYYMSLKYKINNNLYTYKIDTNKNMNYKW